MKKTVTYFCLQFKRAARFFPFVLTVSLLLCLGLGMILNSVLAVDSNAESKQKLSVGIVGNAEDTYLNFGIAAIQSFDSSRFTIDIVELTEPEAREQLEKGKLAAYVIIPDDFVDGIMYGDVKSVTYVTTQGSVGMGTLFKEEISRVVSRIVVESQKGVYGMQKLMRNYGLSGISKHTDAMNLQYFSLILNRTTVLETEVIGISDNLSLAGYMTCGILVLLLLLFGISCCPLFVKKDMSLPSLLCASRQNPLLQITGEYIGYFLLMLANLAVILGAVIVAAGDAIKIIPELDGMGPTELLWLVVRAIPAMLAITALQFLLYELSSSIVSGVLLQFLCAVSLGYISGCFYPIGFLPKTIQTIARFTPSGMARRYLSDLLTLREGTGDLWALIAVFALLFGLTVAMRSYRIKKQ